MMLSSVTIDYADNGGDDDEIDSKIANKMCFFFIQKIKCSALSLDDSYH